MRKWIRFYRIKPMGLKECWKGVKRKEREIKENRENRI
jgi:hypothetical protein